MATLSKLELEDSSKCIFVLSEFRTDSLYLKAFDGSRGWEGSISEMGLRALAERSKTDFPQYVTETKKALSRQELGTQSFLYSVKYLEKKNKIQLVWKKYIASDNVKFQLGEVELSGSSSGSGLASSLLDMAVMSIDELLMSNHQLQSQCERLAKERHEVLQDLTQCADIQDKIEKDLFGKFKLVLNEKKAKIKNLMQSVKHLKEENEDLRRKVWSKEAVSGPSENCSSEPKEQTSANTKVSTTVEDTNDIHSLDNLSGGVPERVGSSRSGKGTASGGMASLLGDINYRAPSPPPAKRRCNKRGHKTVTQLERPLAKARTPTPSASSPPPADKDQDLEPDELLDML